MSRDLALTMPAVTVLSRPKGEPIAITHSPTLRRADIADAHGRQAQLASILSSATSERLSTPTILALNSRANR